MSSKGHDFCFENSTTPVTILLYFSPSATSTAVVLCLLISVYRNKTLQGGICFGKARNCDNGFVNSGDIVEQKVYPINASFELAACNIIYTYMFS